MRLGTYFSTATNQKGVSGIFKWPHSFPVYDVNTNVVLETVKSGEKAKAKINGVVNFMSWMQRKHPAIYSRVMQSRPDLAIPELALRGLGGLHDTQQQMIDAQNAGMDVTLGDTSAPSTSWGKDLLNLITPFAGIYQQKKLFDLNIKRAENGLPPLDSAAPTVNVGVTRGVMTAGTVAGLAVVGMVLLMMFKPRRR